MIFPTLQSAPFIASWSRIGGIVLTTSVDGKLESLQTQVSMSGGQVRQSGGEGRHDRVKVSTVGRMSLQKERERNGKYENRCLSQCVINVRLPWAIFDDDDTRKSSRSMSYLLLEHV